MRRIGSAGGALRVAEPQDQRERRPKRRRVVRVSDIREERARSAGIAFGVGDCDDFDTPAAEAVADGMRMECRRAEMERSGGE